MADPPITPPLKLFWKQNAGENSKNEIVEHNGLVFACSDTLKVFESDGDFFWEYKTETPITTTAFATNSTVIIGCQDGKIIGIDIATHSTSWEVKSDGEIAQGICGKDDFCYIGNSDGKLYKLSPNTGEIHFETSLDAPLSYGPVLCESGLVIGDDNGSLYGINPDTGAIKWKDTIAKSRIGGILLHGDKAFFGSYDNKVYCIKVENGEKIWENRVNGWIEKTPVIVKQKLFVKVRETMLTSFNPETGEKLWSKATQPSSSELLVCDDIIYFGDNRRLSSISSAYIMQQYFEFAEEQITSVSLIGNKVYLGLSVGFSNIGRIACMIPDGSVRVTPQVIEETVSTTDENPEIKITVTNSKDDNWERTVEVGLLTEQKWLSIDKPTFTLEGGESQEITVGIDPFYPGLIGTNNASISVIQVSKKPRHIRPEDKTSIDDNKENEYIIDLPLVITVEDPIAPKLCIETTDVNLGYLSIYSYKRMPLKLSNCGGRTLELTLTPIAYPKWLNVSHSKISIEPGKTAKVNIGATGSKIEPEAGYRCDFQGALKIETNTGEVNTILCKARCLGIPLPTTISLKIGSSKINMNGAIKTFEPPSYITEGRTMVPLRFIAEAFFTSVDWDGDTRTITIRGCDTVISFKVGDITVNVLSPSGEKEIHIDTPPEIMDGRTFIPIRAVSDILGGNISWDGPTKTVGIIYNP